MTPQEELERARNRVPDFERDATRLNKKAVAKARKQAGPLFADHAEADTQQMDARAAYWRWRFGIAAAAGHMLPYQPIGKALQWIRLAAIEAHARALMGDDETWAFLRDHVRRVYPMPEYGPTVWQEILEGTRPVQFNFRRVELEGGKVRVDSDQWPAAGAAPLMTRDDFQARFVIPTPERTDGGPDAEVHARFVAILEARGK
jgi:hypothetical protein